MQEKHNYMKYCEDMSGFGELTEGRYDGWQRINFETKQVGIFGAFK